MKVTLKNLVINIAVGSTGQATITVFQSPVLGNVEPIAHRVFPEDNITPQRLGAELSDLLRYEVAPKVEEAESQPTPPVKEE